MLESRLSDEQGDASNLRAPLFIPMNASRRALPARTTSLTGQVISKKTWRARVTYEMHIPSAEIAREENSLGVLITELSWEEGQ